MEKSFSKIGMESQEDKLSFFFFFFPNFYKLHNLYILLDCYLALPGGCSVKHPLRFATFSAVSLTPKDPWIFGCKTTQNYSF
jgi:hypothetical protein